MQGATAVITGGAGFIGSNLAHRLLSMNCHVIVLDNLSRASVSSNLEWLREQHPHGLEVVVADVRDATAVRRCVARASHVFHFAAQVAVTSSLSDPEYDFDVNARGTLNVLEAVRATEKHPHVFYTSTNKVYGGLDDLELIETSSRYEPRNARVRDEGIAEDRPLDFHSPYGCSKGTADQYVLDYARSYDIPAVVFRMSCIYGPRQFGTEDQGWVAHFLIQALRAAPITIYGDGKQVRDLLFVDDLMAAFLAAEGHMDRVRGKAFNIGGGVDNSVSLLELFALLEARFGMRPALHRDLWRLGDQRYYVTNTERFGSLTGWAPRVGVREGVERLLLWLADTRGRLLPRSCDLGAA
ncbi:SDR family NAD(P)-dependent oxidoreductase [Pendulispora albinea]|uniref:SDR family NAD(P)-dependent oxidoreductase n=1 Tax=Pendulispora albinea TaxID=2741071 RepID=A0ABZ2LYB9_9BACT